MHLPSVTSREGSANAPGFPTPSDCYPFRREPRTSAPGLECRPYFRRIWLLHENAQSEVQLDGFLRSRLAERDMLLTSQG